MKSFKELKEIGVIMFAVVECLTTGNIFTIFSDNGNWDFCTNEKSYRIIRTGDKSLTER